MNTNYKLHSFFDDPPVQIQECDHQECLNEGLYKAPRSRAQIRDYFWFCLEHVRIYNEKWNYFAGMSEGEIEKSWYDVFTWERPTRTFGAKAFIDPLDILEKFKTNLNKDAFIQRILVVEEAKALKIMGLSFPYTAITLKNRYKELAKRYHPDTNGGCAISEEKLKTINTSYEILKKLIKSHL